MAKRKTGMTVFQREQEKKRLIKAVKDSNDIVEFGYKVCEPGKLGGKVTDTHAARLGRNKLSRYFGAINLKEELDKDNPFVSKVLATIKDLADPTSRPMDQAKFQQIKWAMEQLLKMGVGGGYSQQDKQKVQQGNQPLVNIIKNANIRFDAIGKEDGFDDTGTTELHRESKNGPNVVHEGCIEGEVVG
jgi:hypothetical protein